MARPTLQTPLLDLAGRDIVASVSREGNCTVLSLGGEYDMASVPALAEVVAHTITADRSDLVIDLRDVEFMDASTIGVIVRAGHCLDGRSRSLRLRSPSRISRRVLEICELMELVEAPVVEPASGGRTADSLSSWVAVPATDRADPGRRAGAEVRDRSPVPNPPVRGEG